MTFHFRPVLAAFAAAGMALLISLGAWQLHRLAWKLDLIKQTQSRAGAAPAPLSDAMAVLASGESPEYMPVRITGEYRYELEQRVFGTLAGAPGYYLFTPLDLTGEDALFIYVNRGFVPQTVWERGPASVARPEGRLEAAGLFRQPERPAGMARVFAPAGDPEAGLWFVRDPEPMAAVSDLEAIYGYIDSARQEGAGMWPKAGTTRLDFSNRHLEYALTWFGLAAALFGVWLVYSFRRPEAKS